MSGLLNLFPSGSRILIDGGLVHGPSLLYS